MPVGLADGVVDIDETHLPDPGQQRGLRGQPGQEPGGDRVELADVTEGERPQERAHRRGCPDPAEQPAHPPVAEQVQVGDAFCAGDHPRTRPGTFSRAFTPPFAGNVSRAPASSPSPHRRARASTGTSPPHDTRFGSSKTADTPAKP